MVLRGNLGNPVWSQAQKSSFLNRVSRCEESLSGLMRRSENLLMKKKTVNFSRLVKIFNHFIVQNKKVLYNFCRTISRSNQNYLGRRSIKKTIVHKIFIFCNNNKIIFFTEFPNVSIVSLIQIIEFRVSRIGIRFFQYLWKRIGKVRVKKKFQSNSDQISFSISKISKTSGDIFSGKFRKFFQNFFNSHSRRQIIKNIINCNSQSTNAGFSETFSRLDCDNFFVVDHANKFKSQITTLSSANIALFSSLFGLLPIPISNLSPSLTFKTSRNTT